MSEFDIRNTDLKETEKEFERALRPLNFGDFQGQKKIVENLEIFVRAAKMRGESLDHVILHGPPGLGKTTLSAIIANELGVGIEFELAEKHGIGILKVKMPYEKIVQDG